MVYLQAHTGNLTNTAELVGLIQEDLRHINTDSDSAIVEYICARVSSSNKLNQRQIIYFQLLRGFTTVAGAVAAIVMITGYGILGFRDKHGIRPLVFGSRESERGKEYMIASESVALDSQGFLRKDIGQHIDVNNPAYKTMYTSRKAYSLYF